MPFFKEISLPNDTFIYLWKINEAISGLEENLFLNENSLERLSTMKKTSQIQGFLAVRKLLQTINYTDSDLNYDSFGKPHLKDNKKISISHSNEFACIIISNRNVGIDIELKGEKILNNILLLFKEDFILSFKGNKEDKVTLTTISWGIKEALFKLIPENDISFKDNISIQPFEIAQQTAIAEVQINNKTKSFKMYFEGIENYTLVYVID